MNCDRPVGQHRLRGGRGDRSGHAELHRQSGHCPRVQVGDFVVFNDEAADANHAGRRSYECAQIVGPGNTGDVVPTGSFQFQRAYPGVPAEQATFGTLRCAHLAGVKFYKLDLKLFTFAVKKGFFRTPGLPPRVEAKIPSVCVVAALVGVANHFGYGPFTVFPQSHHNEPFMPGDRTCSGGAYTFQIPGSLAAQDNVAIPLKVQNAASIRCVYAYLQQGTSDGQSAYVVKYSTDGGATWNVLEKMGIAQNLGTPFKNTWDFLVAQGYGKPETRRLPYDDYGLITIAAITGSGVAQAVATASYDASTSGLVPGDFVFLEFGLANEEHVNVISVDTVNQTFTAIVTKNHPAGSSIRPSIWPTAVLLEGNDLAFDIKAVASPNAGSDLTVVIQTCLGFFFTSRHSCFWTRGELQWRDSWPKRVPRICRAALPSGDHRSARAGDSRWHGIL